LESRDERIEKIKSGIESKEILDAGTVSEDK